MVAFGVACVVEVLDAVGCFDGFVVLGASGEIGRRGEVFVFEGPSNRQFACRLHSAREDIYNSVSSLLSGQPNKEDCVGKTAPRIRLNRMCDVEDDDELLFVVQTTSGHRAEEFHLGVGEVVRAFLEFAIHAFSGLSANRDDDSIGKVHNVVYAILGEEAELFVHGFGHILGYASQSGGFDEIALLLQNGSVCFFGASIESESTCFEGIVERNAVFAVDESAAYTATYCVV